MWRRVASIGLLVVLVISCARIVALEQTKAELKRDRIELNHIKYGLFNVDEWKRVVAEIITKKVREIEITDANREEMRQKVEQLLARVIDEVERVMQDESTRSMSGFLQGMFMDLFGSMNKVRKGIPRYADQVIDYLNDPDNREELKNYLIKRFNEMADKTVGQTDYSTFHAILAKYTATDKVMCLANLEVQQSRVRHSETIFFILLTLCCVGLVALILLNKDHGTMDLYTMVASAAVLLLTGLSLPMIDIEATISSFSFKLVGEPVTFTDQVLFFQSKSILQVVWLLLKNGGFGLVVVALLVFAFSVLIPISKLIVSTMTIARNERPTHWLKRFLVFKSGKWSMADVMVVAIFMSYIGFNGVINSQLTQLAAYTGNVEIFTTNNSVLQTGFYLFTGYCITGLLLSAMIERRLNITSPGPSAASSIAR